MKSKPSSETKRHARSQGAAHGSETPFKSEPTMSGRARGGEWGAEQILKEIRERCKNYGSQKDVAKSLNVSAQYLGDVLGGRREPGKSILLAMGFAKVVTYRRLWPVGHDAPDRDRKSPNDPKLSDGGGLARPLHLEVLCFYVYMREGLICHGQCDPLLPRPVVAWYYC